MKNLGFYLLMLFFQTGISQNSHIAHIKEISSLESLHFKSISEVRGESLPSQKTHHLSTYWKLSPFERYITGHVTHHFSYDTLAGKSLRLLLSSDLRVDSVLVQNEVFEFQHEADLIEIELTSFNHSDELEVLIYYQGEPPSSGFGSFEINFSPYGSPFIYTLSQPYGSGDWWPSPTYRNRKIDSIDLFIETPRELYAAGNGKLMSISEKDDSSWVHHWSHRHPIAPYLIATTVGNYAIYNDSISLSTGSLPIVNYLYPEEEWIWDESYPRFDSMFRFMDSLLIPYPFQDEKYGHAQFPWSGGMEHQTMSFMRNPDRTLTIHELAHQWFGNYVTCSSWSDIWLNEGFATFLTGVYEQRFRPDEYLIWKAANKEYALSDPMGMVYVEDTSSVPRIFSGSLSYSKGAMVLHMLRKRVGDDVFYKSLRDYLLEFSSSGYAGTKDFQQIVEFNCSCSLDVFFDSWIYGKGYPLINYDWVWVNGEVILEIEIKSSSSEDRSWDFILPLLLESESKDTLIEIHIESGKAKRIVDFPVKPEQITLDPYSDVVAIAAEANIITTASLNMFFLYPNPSENQLFLRNAVSNKYPNVVEIFSIAGVKIGEFEVLSNGKIDFNGRNILASGFFIIRFTFDSQNYTISFLQL